MDKLERKTKMRRLERAALIVLATLGLGAGAIWGFIEGRPLRANFVGLASLWRVCRLLSNIAFLAVGARARKKLCYQSLRIKEEKRSWPKLLRGESVLFVVIGRAPT